MVDRYRESDGIDWEQVSVEPQATVPMLIIILAVGVWGGIIGGLVVWWLS